MSTQTENGYEINADLTERKVKSGSNIVHSRQHLLPTIYIGVPIRNKEHSLPYFLRGIELQDYPTNRIQITFLIDRCVDRSEDVLNTWITAVDQNYQQLTIQHATATSDQKWTQLWTPEHYRHLIDLRQQLLLGARRSGADFYFSIDADVILIYPQTLRHLVNLSLNTHGYVGGTSDSLPLVAPLLSCSSSAHLSNFGETVSGDGDHERPDNYVDIVFRHIRGVFPVPLVHSAFLINLRLEVSRQLNYFQPPISNKTAVSNTTQLPINDLVVFAKSAQLANISFFIDNTVDLFGYFHGPVETDDFDEGGDWNCQWMRRDQEMFVHLRLHAVISQRNVSVVLPSIHLGEEARRMLPKRSKLDLSEIYYINLQRRKDRKEIMEYLFDQLGIDAIHIPAVDGQLLNPHKLKQVGVRMLEGYADPYQKRPLKYGEIGCFLSHYVLWQEMIEHGYQRILIFEDDVRFAPGFQRNFKAMLSDADSKQPDWDLLYIGRKKMESHEQKVPGAHKLIYPKYSYWTLGYVLRRSGAEKLLKQRPLHKMVAVDEYLPIMFNASPYTEWSVHFEPRSLLALSADPCLITPQWYVGDYDYMTDTEDSHILEVSSA